MLSFSAFRVGALFGVVGRLSSSVASTSEGTLKETTRFQVGMALISSVTHGSADNLRGFFAVSASSRWETAEAPGTEEQGYPIEGARDRGDQSALASMK